MASPDKPPFLYVLAAFGLVLGGFGSLYAVASALPLTQSRDQFVSASIQAAEKQAPVVPPTLGGKDDFVHMVGRHADALYSRRGVALPLAGMNVILSLLLFAGCVRALRGQAWGLSAWGLAVKASIPYVLLDCAFSMVQLRDMQDIFREAGGPMGLMSSSMLGLQRLLTLFKSAAELLYFAVCVLYLRRPAIRKLFLPPTA